MWLVWLGSLGADFTDSDCKKEASSGEESDTESLKQPNMRSYRHVLRSTKAGRRRLLKGGDVGRITGSIRLSEYVSMRASTIETPSYSLLITSKTPSPNSDQKGTKTTVLLDTGASISLLPLWKANELGVSIKEKTDVRVRGADGKLLAVVGVGHIFVRDPDATFWKRVTVVVTRDGSHVLISLKDQKRLMLLSPQYPTFLGEGKFNRRTRQQSKKQRVQSDSGMSSGSESSDSEDES